jgi:hypothetical protein
VCKSQFLFWEAHALGQKELVYKSHICLSLSVRSMLRVIKELMRVLWMEYSAVFLAHGSVCYLIRKHKL